MRDVRLRLVVVVVRDEKLDGVVREKLLEFAAQLRGKRFVVRQNERGALELFDDLRHRVRLAGARDAEKRLLLEAEADAARERVDRAGLVAGGLVFTYDLKIGHIVPQC